MEKTEEDTVYYSCVKVKGELSLHKKKKNRSVQVHLNVRTINLFMKYKSFH